MMMFPMAFGFVWMIIPMLLFTLGVALLLWVGVRVFRRVFTDHFSNSERTAVRILQERYARGEIDEEEYHSRMKHLKEN